MISVEVIRLSTRESSKVTTTAVKHLSENKAKAISAELLELFFKNKLEERGKQFETGRKGKTGRKRRKKQEETE